MFRWLRVILGVAILLVLTAVALAVATEPGLRFAVERGLSYYNPRIAGEIRVGEVTGTLFSGFAIRDVHARDARGRSVAELAEFELLWAPEMLLDRQLPIDRLRVSGLRLHQWPDAEADPLADLRPAPGSEAPATPEATTDRSPDGGLGPDLPLQVEARLEFRDAQVHRHTDDAVHVAAQADLTLLAWATGRRATLRIAELSAALPERGHLLHRLRLTAVWDEPVFRLQDLHVELDAHVLDIPRAALDVSTQRGRLSLSVRADPDVVSALAGVPMPGTPHLWLSAAGGLEDFEAELRVELSPGPSVLVQTVGAVLPRPRAVVRVQIDEVAPDTLGVPADAVISGSGQVEVIGPPTPLDALGGLLERALASPEAFVVRADVDCARCRVAPWGPLTLRVRADLVDGAGAAELAFVGMGVTVDASATVAEALDPRAGAVRASWRVRVPDVSATSRVAGLRGLGGALWTQGECWGTVASPRCRGSARADRVNAPQGGAREVRARFDARPLASPPRGEVGLRVRGGHAPQLPGVLDLDLSVVGNAEAARVELTAARSVVTAPDAAPNAAPDASKGAAGDDGARSRAPTPPPLAMGGERVATGLDLRVGEFRPGAIPPVDVLWRHLDVSAVGQTVQLAQPATITLRETAVRVEGLRLEGGWVSVEVDGRADPTGESDVSVRLRVPDLGVAQEVASVWIPQAASDSAASGASAVALGGDLSVTARLAGRLEAPVASVEVSVRDLSGAGQRAGDGAVYAKYEAGTADARIELRDGPARVVRADARAPVSVDLSRGAVIWDPDGAHRARLRLVGVDSEWLRPLLVIAGAEDAPGFALHGSGEVTGTADAPSARVSIDGRVGLSEAAATYFELRARADGAAQAVELEATLPRPADATGRPESLQIVAWARAPIADLRAGRAAPGDIPIAVQVRLPGLDLAGLDPHVPPDLDGLVGHLEIEADARGTVGAPEVSARVTVRDAAVAVIPIGQRLRGIALDVRMADRILDIARLDWLAGRGRGSVRGQVSLVDPEDVNGQVVLSLERFPVLAPGTPPLRIDTRVVTDLRHGPRAGTKVDVALHGTAIEVLSLGADGPRPIPTHSAVRFVDADDPRSEMPGEASGGPAESSSPLNLTVRFAEPLQLRGPLLDQLWGGDVRVSVADGKTQVAGRLSADRGSFDLLGNRFEIEEGEVSLPPGASVRPFVLVVAHCETAEARVTATIRGPADAPELTLTSEPALAPFQILTLLVTGSSQSDDESGGNVEQKAAALLAAFQSPALQRAVSDRVGVDRVQVSFGETADQPILAVGKNLNRWLYAETRYHHNAPIEKNQSEVRTEIRVAPRWTLETAYGDRAIGGVDLFWRMAFPPPTPAATPPPD